MPVSFGCARFIIVRPSRLFCSRKAYLFRPPYPAFGDRLPVFPTTSPQACPEYVEGLGGSRGAGKVDGYCDVQTNNYWSGTTNADNTSNAWNVNLNNGNVNNTNKTNSNYVWPVRGGE